MNIRKIIVSTFALVTMLVATTCFAQISKSDLNIGGIYYGQPWSEVIATYGQPIDKEPRPPKGYNYVFRYGNSTFTSNYWNKGNYVSHVGVKNNCTFSTKAGIHIGSTQADIQAVYGKPDRIAYEGRNLYYNTGREPYDIGNGYSFDIEPELTFRLDKAGGRVIAFWFSVNEYWEDQYPTGSKPQQQKPSTPSVSAKPKSTIPAPVQEMPESEFYIGGITVGQTLDYVEQIYGKPGKIDDQGYFQTYNYNDLFVVKAKLNQGYKVCSVAIYEKGLTTPSGFTADMPYSEVTKKYGVGHEVKFKGEGIEAKLKGCKDFTYFCNNKQMVFLVDKKGIIKAIRVEDRDDSKFIETMKK